MPPVMCALAAASVLLLGCLKQRRVVPCNVKWAAMGKLYWVHRFLRRSTRASTTRLSIRSGHHNGLRFM